MAALDLHCCVQAFSSCGKWGLLFIAVRGLLIAVASLIAEYGLQVRGLQQLWLTGSVVVARGLQSAGSVVVAHRLSCSVACGIFPDQGSNPCPLHWQADSLPLHHQGSPRPTFLLLFMFYLLFWCDLIHLPNAKRFLNLSSGPYLSLKLQSCNHLPPGHLQKITMELQITMFKMKLYFSLGPLPTLPISFIYPQPES